MGLRMATPSQVGARSTLGGGVAGAGTRSTRGVRTGFAGAWEPPLLLSPCHPVTLSSRP